ncbi:hypothetical protein [Actinobaculum sp. 352]|uniref:hypothetical protein n=1 Tax=Actinobaculum sp. 352 TaxID=2490946 RepID=UPI000F7E4438|nr:hypothetical protein [Actinobaculum sp. 352]RTE49169.1 hypothetical protein EKN07_06195 [Actinobaculum sp. 352]
MASYTATPRQVSYAMSLLDKAGFQTRYMDALFKVLGATMRQRSGSVADWLENMTKSEISHLIDDLKERIAESEDD